MPVPCRSGSGSSPDRLPEQHTCFGDQPVGTTSAPRIVTVTLYSIIAADLPAVTGDAWELALATVDPGSGAWVALPTTVNPDGTLSAELNAPGLLSTLGLVAAPDADGSAPDD